MAARLPRPLQRLTGGMRALKQYEFTEARLAATRGSWFREMHSAQSFVWETLELGGGIFFEPARLGRSFFWLHYG